LKDEESKRENHRGKTIVDGNEVGEDDSVLRPHRRWCTQISLSSSPDYFIVTLVSDSCQDKDTLFFGNPSIVLFHGKRGVDNMYSGILRTKKHGKIYVYPKVESVVVVFISQTFRH